MSRALWLMRHAKSAWDTAAETDSERPLAKRGLKDAPRMGQWMRAQGLIPDHMLSSPAERARQTLELVCEELGLDRAAIQWDERIYDATVEDLLQVLVDVPAEPRRILLVGHNPGLEELLRYLCGEDLPQTAKGKVLPTAALARVRVGDDLTTLDAGQQELLGIARPKELES